VTVRYVAAARRLYLAEHTVVGDATATRCGLDVTDPAELWQDIPAGQVTRPCPECSGATQQGALPIGGEACG
jgi:hypothetical protein